MNGRSISTAFPWFSSLTGDYEPFCREPRQATEGIVFYYFKPIFLSFRPSEILSSARRNLSLKSKMVYKKLALSNEISRLVFNFARNDKVGEYRESKEGSFVQRELSRESVTEGLSFIILNLCFCHFDQARFYRARGEISILLFGCFATTKHL